MLLRSDITWQVSEAFLQLVHCHHSASGFQQYTQQHHEIHPAELLSSPRHTATDFNTQSLKGAHIACLIPEVSSVGGMLLPFTYLILIHGQELHASEGQGEGRPLGVSAAPATAAVD